MHQEPCVSLDIVYDPQLLVRNLQRADVLLGHLHFVSTLRLKE